MDRWKDVCMYVRDGWMEQRHKGRKEIRVEGWMDGRDGWKGWMDGTKEGNKGGWMDGWMVVYVDN